MKKIINRPETILDEMLKGFSLAHQDIVERVFESDVIVRKNKKEGKVGLVSGGGSGHEPAHAGFVGTGMLDAAVCGEVFTSPTPDQILKGIQAADSGAGVLLIVKNYSGDIMNFEMAKDLADLEDISCEIVVVDDDIAVEDSTYTAGKRGVAGTILVHKILGSMAEQGASLVELKEAGEKLVEHINTLGVALYAATVPAVGHPGFELAEDEIEFGVGIHGEPGYRKDKLKSADELAKELVDKLKASFNWQSGDEYGILVNGLGATPLMEQYIFLNSVQNILNEEGIKVAFYKVGNYMTALDMTGISLTMIRLEDPTWLKHLNSVTDTAAW